MTGMDAGSPAPSVLPLNNKEGINAGDKGLIGFVSIRLWGPMNKLGPVIDVVSPRHVG